MRTKQESYKQYQERRNNVWNNTYNHKNNSGTWGQYVQLWEQDMNTGTKPEHVNKAWNQTTTTTTTTTYDNEECNFDFFRA